MTGPLAGQHIWVLAKGYAPDEGGMQTYARGVAEGYAALGGCVTVFTQTSAGPRDEAMGPVRLVDVGAGGSAALPWRLLRAMWAERARSPADVIHATTWRTALLPLAASFPYVVTVHGREMSRMRGAGAAIMRLALRRAERIVAVSHYTRDRLLECLPHVKARTIVAWNGKNDAPPDRCRKGDGPPLILTLCRLEPRKNVGAAVRAAAACARGGRDFTYLIAGRGPDRPLIEAEIAAADLGDRIRLLGFVPDAEAARLYGAAHIFLHPQIALEGGCDFEGFGIAIADAMSAGAASIVGTQGGSAELVQDGAGLAVDGNDDAAITAALDQLLGDPPACRAMGERAAERARLFDWQAHCRLVLGL